MKKLALILMVLIAGCKKESVQPTPSYGDVVFWSSDYTGRWEIILDGVQKGSVAQAHTEPNCGNSFFQNYSLTAGVHTIEQRSMTGQASPPAYTIRVYANTCNKFNIN